MKIFLTGMMGAGKSAVGRALASQIHFTFIDTDAVIEAQMNAPVKDIFSDRGEPIFRRREAQVINNLLHTENSVIALGGGALENPDSLQQILKHGTLVWLDVSPEEAARRMSDIETRPLLYNSRNDKDVQEILHNLLEGRQANYSAARYRISVDGYTIEEVVEKIVQSLESTPIKASPSQAITEENIPYSANCNFGALAQIPNLLRRGEYTEKAVIITDDQVSKIYLEQLSEILQSIDFTVHTEVLPAGEQSKSLQNLHDMYIRLSEIGLDRNSPVFALGGGVIGDLAGFLAASYLRGLPLIHLPTTLLAQVDSSIGGKVGVNLPTGKNLVGSFYNPDIVIADLNTLYTLPEREWNTGLGEVLKYGLIGPGKILDILGEGKGTLFQHLAEIIDLSIRHKMRIVSRDFYEGDVRRHLNFGHTLGHALEQATEYTVLNHGEAVFWGIIGALYLSRDTELLSEEKFKAALELMGSIHFSLPPFTVDAEAIYQALFYDKKRVRDTIHWVLLRDFGDPVICAGIEKPPILRAIEYANEFVTTLQEV